MLSTTSAQVAANWPPNWPRAELAKGARVASQLLAGTNSPHRPGISEVVWSQRHTAGSQFPAGQRNRGGMTVFVVGLSEIAGRGPVTTQRPKLAGAPGRTVRRSRSKITGLHA